jgi:hypothetical protein
MVQSSLISKLRKIAIPPAEKKGVEKCVFCGRILEEEHRHLVDLKTMHFMCTCEMCAITMAEANGYSPLPQRVLELNDFRMPDELWSDFLIPVNMAFMVSHSSTGNAIAYYPGPAGATQSKLKMEPWGRLVQLNPVLNDLLPDLESLLINRLNDSPQYFIVPVDNCYELIGRIRLSWKGIFGGREVNDTINDFFDKLKQKSLNARFAI